MRQPESVFVEAPARLHFGLLDLRGDAGRRFGGLGAAIEEPSLRLEARRSPTLQADGPEAERVLRAARAFLSAHGIAEGATLRVQRAVPAHAGLGSGTQLALATGRALAELFGRPSDAPSLAALTDRAQRSAIGTWAFEHGGFLVEGGRREGRNGPGPLLLHRAMPEPWRCVLAIPDVARGLSGPAEERAFRELPPPPAALVERIAHRVLMLILPALVEEDIVAFGRGITEVQRLVGEMFRPVQGERFAHPQLEALVERLLEAGAAGAGQSSWGPATFGVFADAASAERSAAGLRDHVSGPVIVTRFANAGARCTRTGG